jgi:hypothetical protein
MFRSHHRLPVGNSSFLEGSDLRVHHFLPCRSPLPSPPPLSSLPSFSRSRGWVVDEGKERRGLHRLHGDSCRVGCHANIWHPRDRVSINFRPIFNFSQDALLCHAKQSSPPISSFPRLLAAPLFPPLPLSSGDPQIFRGCKRRGSSVARSPRWMLATELP